MTTRPPRALLCPLPLKEVPFEQIGTDLIWPFHRSAHRYRSVLVLVPHNTRWQCHCATSLECRADCFRSSSGSESQKILTDQGTSFMLHTLRELYRLLGIKSTRTRVYHQQTIGLVERLNKTLKSMICKFIGGDPLFAEWDVPQTSTGFSAFEVLFGRTLRGVLDLIKENWEAKQRSSTSWTCDQSSTHWVGCHMTICSRPRDLNKSCTICTGRKGT